MMLDVINRALRKCGFEVRQRREGIELRIVSAVIHGNPMRFAISFADDHIQRHHMAGEFYEEAELQKIGEHFKGGTFVDIGANVGNHSLYAAKFLGAERVIAFEPGPLASTILRCNIALNDLMNVVEVREVGLSDKPGRAQFDNWAPYNLGAARIHLGDGDTIIMAGDQALEGEKVDFIKIDTEGLEAQVLNGLRNTMATQRPTVFVEVEERNARAVAGIFSAANYVIRNKMPSYENMANWIAEPA